MAPPAYSVVVRPVHDMQNATSVSIRGTVRYDQAPELRERIVREVSTTDSGQVVIELSEVDAMDTSGAAVLVEALILGRKRKVRVLFCSPSESVVRIFRLAGFEEALDACCPNPGETRRRLLQ